MHKTQRSDNVLKISW